MLRFIDGFDHYTADNGFLEKYDSSGSVDNMEVRASEGRRGGGCIRLYSAGSNLRKTFEDQEIWVVGFALKLAVAPTGTTTLLKLLDSAGGVQCSVNLTTTGSLTVTRGTSTLLGTSSTSISAGIWVFVEAKIQVHDTLGAVNLRINEVEVLALSGIDTKDTTLSKARAVRLGGINTIISYIDDLYICDGQGAINNNFLGDVRIDTIFPTGAGSQTDFTPVGTGNNWDNVNDTNPDGDTGYNTSAVVGDTDLFAFSDLPSISGTIFGVQANLNARKDDAGTGGMKPVVYLASTEYEGTEKAMSDSYFDHTMIWELNPNTSVAWTQSDINGAEFGYKVAS